MPASIPPITMHERILKPNAEPWRKWLLSPDLVGLRDGSVIPTCWRGSILSNERQVMRRYRRSWLRERTAPTPVLRITRSCRLPLSVLCSKFSHTRFEPSGWSGVKEIGYAKSVMDYIARWLALKFLPPTSPSPTGVEAEVMPPTPPHLSQGELADVETDAPACKECGAIMSRSGSCYRCGNCGWTSGCS